MLLPNRNFDAGPWKPNPQTAVLDLDDPINLGRIACWPLGDAAAGVSTNIVATTNTADATLSGVSLAPSDHGGLATSFNGTSSFAQATVDLSKWNAIILAFRLYQASFNNSDGLAFEYTANFGVFAPGFLVDPNASSGKFEFGASSLGPTFNDYTFTRPATGWRDYVLYMPTDSAIAPQAFVDGVAVAVTVNVANSSLHTFANSTLNFMCRNGASLFNAGRLEIVSLYVPGLCLPPAILAQVLHDEPYAGIIEPGLRWRVRAAAGAAIPIRYYYDMLAGRSTGV